ncbi:hypothetical protein ACLX1H_009341 [Fusarium chlamydosporum]
MSDQTPSQPPFTQPVTDDDEQSALESGNDVASCLADQLFDIDPADMSFAFDAVVSPCPSQFNGQATTSEFNQVFPNTLGQPLDNFGRNAILDVNQQPTHQFWHQFWQQFWPQFWQQPEQQPEQQLWQQSEQHS